MQDDQLYDVAIIGGGLAGLALSIQLARKAYSVVLIEKEKYPFHKVCGEYVSMESWHFLETLGIELTKMDLPIVNRLQLTAQNGATFTTKLPLGGFGISRYKLDALLAEIAAKENVVLLENTKAEEVSFANNFTIKVITPAGHSNVHSKVCIAAYGKRSNLDVKWKRNFLYKSDKRLDNYVAVKYHIMSDWVADIIGLHNFENGYCGISKIEEDKYCLCYMTRSHNLKASGNDIGKMEKKVLYKNPYLKNIFSTCTVFQTFPITISQINFSKKSQVDNNILFLGDAGGTITPLCGNGMSMALHSSKIAAAAIDEFFVGQISRAQMEQKYQAEWNAHFASRLSMGRILQRFFGKHRTSQLFIWFLKLFPLLAGPIIKKTHGHPF